MKGTAVCPNRAVDSFLEDCLPSAPFDDVKTLRPTSKPCQLARVEERLRNAHTIWEDAQRADVGTSNAIMLDRLVRRVGKPDSTAAAMYRRFVGRPCRSCLQDHLKPLKAAGTHLR